MAQPAMSGPSEEGTHTKYISKKHESEIINVHSPGPVYYPQNECTAPTAAAHVAATAMGTNTARVAADVVRLESGRGKAVQAQPDPSLKQSTNPGFSNISMVEKGYMTCAFST